MDNSICDIFDLLLAPLYIIAILFFAYFIQLKNKPKKAYYRFFMPAIICKITGAVFFCLIYAYYYKNGDPINYYFTGKSYVNILINDGFSAFAESINYYKNDIYLNSHFNIQNGTFWFHHDDYYALFVVAITSPIILISFKSFVVSTIILSTLSFIGTWKLYEIYIYHYPKRTKEFGIAILFIPSVAFWGSGLLKDTYTFCFVGLITYCVFKFFIIKQRHLKYIIYLLVISFLTLMIKPYILVALLPGTLVWIGFERIQKIKNSFVRILGIPLLLIGLATLTLLAFTFFEPYLGDYSLNSILNKAVITQQDLLRSDYGSNNFNIGKFEPTVSSILSKAPIAIFSALFRPFLWEIRNPVMLISAIESSIMLCFCIYVLFKIKLRLVLNVILSNPLLVFSLLFSIFFAFSVGLTTANFGALTRLRIPCIPFFVSSLLIIYYHYKEQPKRR